MTIEVIESRFRIGVDDSAAVVSSLLCLPAGARWMLALAHSAGAGMRHAFMDACAEALAVRGVATFRYQFPYMENGSRRPDSRRVLLATVRAAVAAAHAAAPGLPLLAGGKSMGGRMTALAAAEEALPKVQGIAFFGFPLHPAGRASAERGEHLSAVTCPMLFLQGTRDKLAELEWLEPVCAKLGPVARLIILDGADHSFHVLKGSGRSDEEVLDEAVDAFAAWAQDVE